jgi:hypothetical protein
MFLAVRLGELIFEVLPETVLQLFVIYHTKDISWTSIISILSSVASAAFTMTDNSMMFERHMMVSVRGEKAIPDFTHPLHPHTWAFCFPTQNRQKRGPYTHPIFGFIPSKGPYVAAIQFGMFLFYGGFISCSMIALSAVLTAFNWYYVPLVMGCEFALFVGVQASREQLLYVLEAPGSKTVSSVAHVGFYLIMSFCPWVQLRVDDGNLGGGWYSSMIIYKLLSNAAIVIYATGQFAEIDRGTTEVFMEGRTARTMFFIVVVVTIAGVTLFLTCVQQSHRWTFYASRMTGPEFYQWYFDATQLMFDAETKEQQRVYFWLGVHPCYFDQDKVKEWLLGLQSDGEILSGVDKKLPKGCSQFTGHSLDSFFTKSLESYAYYNDTEGFPLVEAHLNKLKEEVDSRPLVVTVKGATVRSSIKEEDKKEDKEEDKEEEGKGMKANDEEEILRLKALLSSKEKEISEKKREVAEEREENRVKFMAKEKEIQERDELLQERNEMIQERDEKIARLLEGE